VEEMPQPHTLTFEGFHFLHTVSQNRSAYTTLLEILIKKGHGREAISPAITMLSVDELSSLSFEDE
jgi:hypothetical protein